MISPPRVPLGHPDRRSDCEAAMKADLFTLLARGQMPEAQELADLAEEAGAAGWTAEEIAAAVAALTESYTEAGKAAT